MITIKIINIQIIIIIIKQKHLFNMIINKSKKQK